MVEGNRAWAAACTVRRRWLAEVLLPRRTAPKQTMAFITAQVLAMPAPLRDALASAPGSVLFYELTKGNFRAAEVEAWPAPRLPLVLLAAVAAAYEDRMGGDPGKATWRAGRYSPCSREEAGAWFRFLGEIGYELSLIEQAAADEVPYPGEQAGGDLTMADTPDSGTDDPDSGHDDFPGEAVEDTADAGAGRHS
jgi:hypothetical protein